MRLIKWNRNNEHLNNGNYKHFIFFYYRLSPSIKVTFFNFWISLYVRWLREISLLNNEHGWYENTSFCHRAITIEINISQVTPGLTFVKILILFTGNMMAKVSTTPIEHCCLHCRWIIVEYGWLIFTKLISPFVSVQPWNDRSQIWKFDDGILKSSHSLLAHDCEWEHKTRKFINLRRRRKFLRVINYSFKCVGNSKAIS